MSAYREFTGKTVEEALRLAREAFGDGLDDLDFEILTPGSRGVLGMGAEPARIARIGGALVIATGIAGHAATTAGTGPRAGTIDPEKTGHAMIGHAMIGLVKTGRAMIGLVKTGRGCAATARGACAATTAAIAPRAGTIALGLKALERIASRPVA